MQYYETKFEKEMQSKRLSAYCNDSSGSQSTFHDNWVFVVKYRAEKYSYSLTCTASAQARVMTLRHYSSGAKSIYQAEIKNI